MKKVFGFFLIGFGIVILIQMLADGAFSSFASFVGGFLGIALLCFLPACFLMRNKKKFIDPNEGQTSNSQKRN